MPSKSPHTLSATVCRRQVFLPLDSTSLAVNPSAQRVLRGGSTSCPSPHVSLGQVALASPPPLLPLLLQLLKMTMRRKETARPVVLALLEKIDLLESGAQSKNCEPLCSSPEPGPPNERVEEKLPLISLSAWISQGQFIVVYPWKSCNVLFWK
jgi:hypothetical protein